MLLATGRRMIQTRWRLHVLTAGPGRSLRNTSDTRVCLKKTRNEVLRSVMLRPETF
jgi:hypothetical protein